MNNVCCFFQEIIPVYSIRPSLHPVCIKIFYSIIYEYSLAHEKVYY